MLSCLCICFPLLSHVFFCPLHPQSPKSPGCLSLSLEGVNALHKRCLKGLLTMTYDRSSTCSALRSKDSSSLSRSFSASSQKVSTCFPYSSIRIFLFHLILWLPTLKINLVPNNRRTFRQTFSAASVQPNAMFTTDMQCTFNNILNASSLMRF